MNRSVYMLLGLVGLISGCQSTNLYTEPDTGSTVFPFDITAEARFPCRKVGFELNLRNEGTEDNADYGYREFFINDGDTFGLISGLKPAYTHSTNFIVMQDLVEFFLLEDHTLQYLLTLNLKC